MNLIKTWLFQYISLWVFNCYL